MSAHSRRAPAPDPRKHFDSAALGLVSPEVRSRATQPFTGSWDDLMERARHSFGELLAPRDDGRYTYDPNRHITLFANSTSAFSRILAQIAKEYASSKPTLLTNDLEFPGCVAAIDDSWSGPVVMALIDSTLRGATADPDTLLHDALVRAFNFVNPDVVFVSHVMRTTGQVISPATLTYFREANPRVIVILDGSQAVGNVVVTQNVLEQVDCYIASGHKWVGGMTTSGFAWQRQPGYRKIADPGQSLAQDRQLGGSGNSDAWCSLILSVERMVQDAPLSRLEEISAHNRKLGKLFKEMVESSCAGVKFVTPYHEDDPPSGLITVGLALRDETTVAALERERFVCTKLGYERVWWDSPTADRFLLECDSEIPAILDAGEHTAIRTNRARTELRFCFHHWHEERDVEALAAVFRRPGSG